MKKKPDQEKDFMKLYLKTYTTNPGTAEIYGIATSEEEELEEAKTWFERLCTLFKNFPKIKNL